METSLSTAMTWTLLSQSRGPSRYTKNLLQDGHCATGAAQFFIRGWALLLPFLGIFATRASVHCPMRMGLSPHTDEWRKRVSISRGSHVSLAWSDMSISGVMTAPVVYNVPSGHTEDYHGAHERNRCENQITFWSATRVPAASAHSRHSQTRGRLGVGSPDFSRSS